MSAKSLESLRKAVKKKDTAIVRLLGERASLAVEIGRLKRLEGWEVYDPAQESQVYRCLEEMNEGPLPDEALRVIYREILSASRALQAPVTVAYLGPETSFSHQAALGHFGRGAEFLPQATIAGVFDAVERGPAEWGIVPVENSTGGSVKSTLDGLISTPLVIRAEVFARVRHCLLSAGSDPDGIERVYSHPQALAQCRDWLKQNLPRAVLVETDSTTAAARKVLDDPAGAAVAGRLAAEEGGLCLLVEGIEDSPLNTTRFLVLGTEGKAERGAVRPTGRDKTSILFGTADRPGALHEALAPFAAEGVNLTRIESYPARDRMWEYLFFADLAGHREEKKPKKCLEELAKRTSFLKILGSYPRGDRQP
jgi:chorismate mutase/prephenate dehydratase